MAALHEPAAPGQTNPRLGPEVAPDRPRRLVRREPEPRRQRRIRPQREAECRLPERARHVDRLPGARRRAAHHPARRHLPDHRDGDREVTRRAISVAARKVNAERALRLAEAGRKFRHPCALGRLGERQRHKVDQRRRPFRRKVRHIHRQRLPRDVRRIIVREKVHAGDHGVRLQHQFGAGRRGEHSAIILEPERARKPGRQRRQELANEIVLTINARRRESWSCLRDFPNCTTDLSGPHTIAVGTGRSAVAHLDGYE